MWHTPDRQCIERAREAISLLSLSAVQGVNVRKEVLEDQFLELLEALIPRPRFMKLLKAIVLDVWKARQADARKLLAALESRLECADICRSAWCGSGCDDAS